MSDIEHKSVLIFILIYTVITTIFLIKLNQLNNILHARGYDQHAFELLKYNDFQPIGYFVFTIILCFAGGILIYFLGRCMFQCGEATPWEFLILLLGILIVIGLIILLICFIQNPIFRAILVAVSVGVVGVAALNIK
ncbi:hypothetical protein HB952_05455 [Listeria welshimeri]|nr:hypothetical protein [Listeria welshimeri]MBC1517647.1 hypothetical protein [Listeria welshimeri]MBC1627291.1 hypothetical protein [Listeria welshimeri]MBC1669212.1 hypothetical protein [Listeria welshimeri]